MRAIEQERSISRSINLSSLPAPAVGDIVEIEGRYGLVYERVIGVPLLDIMPANPLKIFEFSRFLAELHVNMHGIVAVQSLPSQHCT